MEAALVGWGEAAAQDGASTLTDASGRFLFPALLRRSVLLRLRLAGRYDEVVAVDRERPLSEALHDAGTSVLVARRPGLLRFMFGGDVMFGRRYVDRDEDGVTEATDLIQPGSPGDDAKRLLRFLRPLLSSSDYTQVNLETPVTASPVTVHPYKEFKFHSHPDTLQALPYVGVQGVSLGNNHTYDFLEQGMIDTIQSVSDAGLDWFGAGMSESDARSSFLSRNLNGVQFAMQGFNGIIPFNFPPWGPIPWEDSLLYVAMDDPVKGGALRLDDGNLDDFLTATAATHFSVPVLHGGFEYGEYPSENMRKKVKRFLETGAGVVVSHHPHTLYGIAHVPGVDGFAFLSLGNLLFDQDVFETFQSVVGVVDVEQTAPGRHVIRRVRLVPFHIERYVPKLVSGDWRGRIGRHLGHISTYLPPTADPNDPPDGLVGAVVFPAHNRVAVCFDPAQYGTSDSTETITLPVSGGTAGPLGYSRTGDADSLARVETDFPALCEYGRELAHYGDFEDLDVDDEFHEGDLWKQSPLRFVQNSVVRRGIGALALLRGGTDVNYVSTWMRNRVTFAENVPLTLTGYLKGGNAGEVHVVVRWYVRFQRSIISTVTRYVRPAGTYDWERFVIELAPPPEAGTFRAYFRHHPPEAGEGYVCVDDIALIQWEGSAQAGSGVDLPTPNDWSWLRFTPLGPARQSLEVTLTHRLYTLPPTSP
ncbi:MAG: CapA family protein [Planctomycetota bacterium]|nr:CapA family protein [Planctomycetota bacterium]